MYATLGEVVDDGEGGKSDLYTGTEAHPDRSMALLEVARGYLAMGYLNDATCLSASGQGFDEHVWRR